MSDKRAISAPPQAGERDYLATDVQTKNPTVDPAGFIGNLLQVTRAHVISTTAHNSSAIALKHMGKVAPVPQNSEQYTESQYMRETRNCPQTISYRASTD